MIGAIHALAVTALAPAAALFYGEPRVVDVMLALAVTALVSGFRNIGMVEFEQDLRFGPIVALALIRRTSSFLVTLVLAWQYRSYWALLGGMMTGPVIDLLLSYYVSRYRPRFSLARWHALFSFSKWLLVNSVLAYASNRGGDLIVGHRAGAAALGTYSVSFELANLPTSEMVWPVMRAVFPGYAMMSADRQRLAQGFLNVFALVLLFALPAAAGIALLAEPMVAVLLGPKWSDAAPMVQVLAIYGGIRATQANTGSVYLALDRPQYAAAITLLGIVLGFGSFAVALWHSVPVAEAAWFLVGGSLIVVVINLTLLTRLLGLRWSDIFRALLRPAIGITVMAAALALLRGPLWNGGHPLAAGAAILVGLVLAGAIVYLASVMLAWRADGRPVESPEYAVLATLAGSVRRRKAA